VESESRKLNEEIKPRGGGDGREVKVGSEGGK
jgi:hypothetical protein